MFNNRDANRERKLDICNRIRSRRTTPDTRRPIADVLELRLEDHGKYLGDSEIHRSLVSYQRFQFEGKVGS